MIMRFIWRKEHNPHLDPIYNLSHDEYLVPQKYIDENLEKGFIRHSRFLVSVPILFVKKNDRPLHMCVDYHGLNRFTIKNRYPLPWSQDCWNNLIMPKCILRLTYVEHTTWCAFEKVMNGRHRSKFVMAILNILWRPLTLPMHL